MERVGRRRFEPPGEINFLLQFESLRTFSSIGEPLRGILQHSHEGPAIKAGSLRRDFPWRRTHDPYKILVSEIMLQQTQVSRVLIKYPEFLKKFPTLKALARARLADVLRVWQGMGYNRRALHLHTIARTVKKIPDTYDELRKLPGIGSYTAAAVMNFAYNKPTAMIETNIRRVFIHAYNITHDRDILELVEKTIDRKNPREWFFYLMDLGSTLPKSINRRSAHYAKQSPFEGSRRQRRARELREMLKNQRASDRALAAHIDSA